MSGFWIDALERVPGEATAVDDGMERLTYAELRSQSRRHAAELERAYGTGRTIILPAESSTAFIRTLLAVMWSGNVPVPVDPGLPLEALRYVREKSEAVASLTPLGPPPDGPEANRYSSEQPALVMFTSGTTGFPKGVIVSDANLRHSCHTIGRYLDYGTHRSAAVALPLFYSYALISQVLCQLYVGGRVRLFRDLRNPLKFAAAVEAGGLETFCGVPTTYHTLLAFHAIRRLSMPSVRVLCSAGAPMDRTILETLREIFPNATLFNNYGMTEAAPRIAFIRDDDPRFPEPTCGRPMDGVEVRIIDPDTEQELSDGESGMLVIKGPNVTVGYLNDPGQSAQAFTSDGFLKSGDMAYVDRGYIFIRGRYDDVFNCGGEKVAPLEIERALASCPGVEAAAVTGAPDPQRGMVPVAFVKSTGSVTRQQLLDHLMEQLPLSRIPVRFYLVSGFPTTANGKLQRKRLLDSNGYVLSEL